MIKIRDEELAKLKEQGMTDHEIAEHLTKRGIKISTGYVNLRLRKYYEKQGIEKPNPKRKIRISIEELAELKERGISDREIAEHLTKQGIKISKDSVSKKLKKYYETQGKEKPKLKTRITDEELVKLKKQGMSNREIAEQFTKQVIKISESTISLRLRKYYETRGMEKPKVEREVRISIEELVELKEQGMTDGEIAEELTKQGRKILEYIVSRRLREYYASQGRKKPRAQRKARISIEELVGLKEQGMSDGQIAQYFSEQGIEIKTNTIAQRLYRYYKSKKQEKPRAKVGVEKKITISDEELVNLKEQGMTDNEIAQKLTKQGIKISESTVYKRLKKHYELQGKEKPRVKFKRKSGVSKKIGEEKKYGNPIKQMLMNGMNVYEIFPDGGEQLEDAKRTLEKLKLISLYSEKANGEWVSDYDFAAVIC